MSAIMKGSDIPNPKGERCKRCHKVIREDGHKGWCSSDCAQSEREEFSQAKLRAIVTQRDKGVCGWPGCGLDCLALRQEIDALRALGETNDKDRKRWGARVHQLKLLGFDEDSILSGSALFEVDHVQPKAAGGISRPEACRTLCIPHHKQATGAFASKRAASRKPNGRRFGR